MALAAAVISNLGHPLKIGYLARPELRRHRACSHRVRSCCADVRALSPCEICFFCVPFFAGNRSGAGFYVLRRRSVFSLWHDHEETQFPVVAFNCRSWMRSVTHSIRRRNKQADHRPRDRGQKRNQTKGVAQAKKPRRFTRNRTRADTTLAHTTLHGPHPFQPACEQGRYSLRTFREDCATIPRLNREIKKYLKRKAPSRPGSGPPQLRQTISRSVVGPGRASIRTTSYSAPQVGHLKFGSDISDMN